MKDKEDLEECERTDWPERFRALMRACQNNITHHILQHMFNSFHVLVAPYVFPWIVMFPGDVVHRRAQRLPLWFAIFSANGKPPPGNKQTTEDDTNYTRRRTQLNRSLVCDYCCSPSFLHLTFLLLCVVFASLCRPRQTHLTSSHRINPTPVTRRIKHTHTS